MFLPAQPVVYFSFRGISEEGKQLSWSMKGCILKSRRRKRLQETVFKSDHFMVKFVLASILTCLTFKLQKIVVLLIGTDFF